MTIKKNGFLANLKIQIVQLLDVSVILPRESHLSIQIGTGHMVSNLLRENPLRRGIPELVSIENGRFLSVFPMADKRYRLRVLGTQYVEQ